MKNIKTLFVGGNFDDKEGKKSTISQIISDTLQKNVFEIPGINLDCYNGGTFKELEKIVQNCGQYELIFWFPNISNDKDKLVKQLKVLNPEHILVTSKNNMENKYLFEDLIYHALNNHSNLFLEFTKENDRIKGRIIDPLGNVFLDHNDNFELVSQVLKKRCDELINYTRVRSSKIDNITYTKSDNSNNESEHFLKIIRGYANTFHELIHPKGDAQTRFMGNASFRCEYGFPSSRTNNGILVSKRNIDKREINLESFVLVNNSIPVEYHGNFKPSVDTPIQVGLYNYYNKVNYMIHSHTYIQNAPFTENIIPCGALEEIEEIVKLFPDKNTKDFSVNLKGHGSIVFSSNISNLENIQYYARPIPEIHQKYLAITSSENLSKNFSENNNDNNYNNNTSKTTGDKK
ncbi:MAG: class II aldolase/adducin family protein [Candidatus Woesearchaeota archaeon]